MTSFIYRFLGDHMLVFRLIVLCICISLASIWAVPAHADCDKLLMLYTTGKARGDRETYLLDVVRKCPNNIRAHELIGNLYRKYGQRRKAIEFFLRAAELGSTNYKLYYLLADLLFQKDDLDEAHKYLKNPSVSEEIIQSQLR